MQVYLENRFAAMASLRCERDGKFELPINSPVIHFQDVTVVPGDRLKAPLLAPDVPISR